MLKELKEQVFKANLDLVRHGLVLFTWGNASGIDRERGLVVIKPSGVEYERLTADDLVVVDLEGRIVEGRLRPSTDTPTHLELYKAFPETGGIVHTHSTYACAWAQAGMDIPCLGTTHADHFCGPVPCTGDMFPEEIAGEYEKETGTAIIRRFKDLDASTVPGVLVKNHGPFTWGKSPEDAVYNAAVLEEVARMALLTLQINPSAEGNPLLNNKHFSRKHGAGAYYGQK